MPDWEPSELDVSAREVVNGEALAELDGRKPAEPVKTSPELASPEETLEPDCAALPVSEAAEAAEGVETEVPRVVGAGVGRPDDGAVDNAADPDGGAPDGTEESEGAEEPDGGAEAEENGKPVGGEQVDGEPVDGEPVVGETDG